MTEGAPVRGRTEDDASEVAGRFGHHDEDLDHAFETYRTLRSGCPVGRSERYGGFWFFTRYEDIYQAEQSPQTFSVSPSMLLPSFGNKRPLIPIDIDPPMLPRYRRILLPSFAPGRIDAVEPMVREVAHNLIDSFVLQGRCDASLEFARPFPTLVFIRMAGFPERDYDRFQDWVDRIIYVRTHDSPETARAAEEVSRYFLEFRERRLQEPPRDDLVGKLLAAEIDGRALTPEEFADYCFLLLVAGLETTAWAVRASLWHLAQHPQDQLLLRQRPELVASAAEEFLRCLSPVQAMARTLKRDVEVGGRRLQQGERVLLVFGSGNRDEDVFDDPDRVRVDREHNPHLAFGVGVHRCLGANLGRRELRVALEEFLRRIPEFRLETGEVPSWWGIGPLPLVFGERLRPDQAV
ncbi:MAG TPA: cytochrome P450 [Actinomycetes bacterium]|jgi:cytochrome P450|nr:cytochrome P450 [Actinomycetes bacterium]